MKQVQVLVKKVLSLLPTKLPVGSTEFNSFANDIIELAGPYADRDSMTWAIANMVIHLPSGVSSKPKNYFVRNLRKAAANQVASQVFQDIKFKQEQAALAAKQAAAVPQQVVDTTAETLTTSESL